MGSKSQAADAAGLLTTLLPSSNETKLARVISSVVLENLRTIVLGDFNIHVEASQHGITWIS